MKLDQVLAIFCRTIDSLQLCQCVRDIECSGNFEFAPLERVILHTICGLAKPSDALNKSYGDGVCLNDMFDAQYSFGRYMDMRREKAAEDTQLAPEVTQEPETPFDTPQEKA